MTRSEETWLQSGLLEIQASSSDIAGQLAKDIFSPCMIMRILRANDAINDAACDLWRRAAAKVAPMQPGDLGAEWTDDYMAELRWLSPHELQLKYRQL